MLDTAIEHTIRRLAFDYVYLRRLEMSARSRELASQALLTSDMLKVRSQRCTRIF